MKAEDEATRKVAFVDIPVPDSAGNATKTTCGQCCSCTCFRVSMPSINSSAFGTQNRQKLLAIIQELEAEFATQRESIGLEYQRRFAEVEGRLRDAENRAQADRTNLQAYLNRPQPTIDESSLKIEIVQLRDKLTTVEKERDALLRNKVTFIEANLAERNAQLENEIECLKLHHKDDIEALEKSWREKEAQWNSSGNNVREEKMRLELKIRTFEGQMTALQESLKKEEAAKTLERQKNEEHLREVARLKSELHSAGQVSKSEVQLMRERIQEYKQRLASAEGKFSGHSKQKEELFKSTIEQKAELERRGRVINDLEHELRRQEELFNNKIRDITADFQNRLRGMEEEASRIHNEKLSLEKDFAANLGKHQSQATSSQKKLQSEHQMKVRSLEQQHAQRLKRLEEEWVTKMEQLQAEHLRETTRPPKIETKTEYVYIEKQIQSPELKIATEKLLQLTTKSLSLETQIEDLRLENVQLKERLNFLSGLEAAFNKEKQKWRLERDEMQKRLSDFELRGSNRNRFEWAVQRIIDAEGRGQEHFRYREGGIRVVDSTDPNIVYKVISPEHVYQSLTDRLEGDVRRQAVERVVVEQEIRHGD